MNRLRSSLPVLPLAAWMAFTPAAAAAYVGPGLGQSAVGALVALLAAVVFALVGFVWYPVQRLLQRRADDTGELPTRTRVDATERPWNTLP